MVHSNNSFFVLKLGIYMCNKFIFNNNINLFLNQAVDILSILICVVLLYTLYCMALDNVDLILYIICNYKLNCFHRVIF